VYLLLGDEIQGKFRSFSGGATVLHLNMKEIRNLELPALPPIATQHNIASILSAYDDLIESNKDRMHFPLVLGCVSSDDFVSHATKTSQGTKMPRTDWKVLVKYPFVIPPQQALRQYNCFIDSALGMIQNLAHRNRNLRQTRDLLLPKLISGEIAV
jgi:restriction endonuclease S subunit